MNPEVLSSRINENENLKEIKLLWYKAMMYDSIVHMKRKYTMNDKAYWSKAIKPEELKKKAYISLRVTESEKARINKVIGDNLAIREFLLEHCKSHE